MSISTADDVPPRPPWLTDLGAAEEADIRALLTAALDRFDETPAAQRQQPLRLTLKPLRSLLRSDAQAETVWGLVGELERLGVLAIRRARHDPRDPDWTGAALAFPLESEAVLRAWLERPSRASPVETWRAAVQAHAGAFAQGGAPLLERPPVPLAGRTSEEVVEAFARIGTVHGPITLRQLSATVFWGDSKVLDTRGDLVRALFPHLVIRERAIPVSVFLPAEVRGVLFIENQDTYVAATAGFPPACRKLALVYAAGFRGTARSIRDREGVVLHYAGSGVARWQAVVEGWWLEGKPAPGAYSFWGDLDFAGMQILKALRARFPEVSAWRPGYEPMLAALKVRGGHRPGNGEPEAAQTDPRETGCAFADEVLLPAIRQLGRFDQESVSGGVEEAGSPGGGKNSRGADLPL